MSISLVVVTRDRFPYLRRLLDYYAEHRYRGPILVADASVRNSEIEAAGLRARFANRLDLNLTTYPAGTSVQDRMHSEILKVCTPFMTWVGDDDFLVPAALEKAAQRLSDDPGCSAVVGNALLFEVEGDEARGRILRIGPYAQYGYAGTSPWLRLLSYIENPCALTFAVRRTIFARELWSIIRDHHWPSEVYFHAFYEMLDAAISVIAGTVWRCPSLTLVRQVRTANAVPSVPEWRSVSSIVGKQEFASFLGSLAAILVDEIQKHSRE